MYPDVNRNTISFQILLSLGVYSECVGQRFPLEDMEMAEAVAGCEMCYECSCDYQDFGHCNHIACDVVSWGSCFGRYTLGG